MDLLRVEIPYPPSINHYYIRTHSGVMLTPAGRSYRRDVALLLHKYREYCSTDKRLKVTINVYPPDKRKRDLDNICKATLDSLQYAKIFHDDNQIDMLSLIRREVVKNGYLAVWIDECLSNE